MDAALLDEPSPVRAGARRARRDEDRHHVHRRAVLRPRGRRDLGREVRQRLGSGLRRVAPEQDLAHAGDPLGRAAPMGQLGDVARQRALGDAPLGRGGVLRLQLLDPAPVEHREPAQVDAHVAIVRVDPVLVEAVGRGERRVQPDRLAGLALAELGAGRREQERVGEAVGRLPAAGPGARRAPDQLQAGRDVPPLVGAAALQLDPVRALQVGEVGRLQEHVAELGEGEPLADPGLRPSPCRACTGS